ncbi:hypothetical protein QFC21_003443 [Naganishia friedmannii]|uniref:Uncharacterized protein n=1 Tax=Naganishia friedmannii TaxID=89922 RepID=A0ACC2VQC8_9TREE|nr:hypothetical protein QFC21_003443 [Naganishia friedmannii]
MTSTATANRTRRAQNPLIKPYLIAYNALSLLGWSTILFLVIQFIIHGPHVLPPVSGKSATGPLSATAMARQVVSGLGERFWGLGKSVAHLPSAASVAHTATTQTTTNPFGSLIPSKLALAIPAYLSGSYAYHSLGPLVVWTQTAALLEVVHALTGMVRSNAVTVGMQVASRVWMVWGVVNARPETHASPLFTTMILAWSVTEVVRYSFYLLALLNLELKPLLWARYNLFYILYPLGAGSEAFLMASVLPRVKELVEVLRHGRKTGLAAMWSRVAALGAGKGREWGAYELFVGFLFVIWWPGTSAFPSSDPKIPLETCAHHLIGWDWDSALRPLLAHVGVEEESFRQGEDIGWRQEEAVIDGTRMAEEWRKAWGKVGEMGVNHVPPRLWDDKDPDGRDGTGSG